MLSIFSKILKPFKSSNKYRSISYARDNIQDKWWGDINFKPGELMVLRIGDTILEINTNDHNIQIFDYPISKIEQAINSPLQFIKYLNYPYSQDCKLCIYPCTADKNIVLKLDHPFFIPTNSNKVLYGITPTWFNIKINKNTVINKNSTTLSETWPISSNTTNGQVCYAGNIFATESLSTIENNLHYIITPIIVENKSNTTLQVNKITLPLPYLSTFADNFNQLWTEQLYISMHKENEYAKIIQGSPDQSKQLDLIHKPRLKNFRDQNIDDIINAITGR